MSDSQLKTTPITVKRLALTITFVGFVLYFSGVADAQDFDHGQSHQYPVHQNPVHQSSAIESGLDHGLVADPPIHSPSHQSVFPANQNGAIQLDAVTPLPIQHLHPPITVSQGNRGKAGRPVSADLSASLANFDADADPDGWRAHVVIRDLDGRPVVMRSHATFELIPRIPLVGTRNRDIGDFDPIKWSKPLEYDQRGVASVTLPLRQHLKPVYGWTVINEPAPFGSVTARSGYRTSRSRFGRKRMVFASTWRERIEMPSTGILKVRVSVPTAGVYEAVAPVRLRPSVYLEESWGLR